MGRTKESALGYAYIDLMGIRGLAISMNLKFTVIFLYNLILCRIQRKYKSLFEFQLDLVQDRIRALSD